MASQGSCGSCWVWAATDTIADRLCIASQGHIQTRLSPWHLLQCCGLGDCADGIIDFGGCAGGDVWSVWRFYTERGIVSADCKPIPKWVKWYGIKPMPKNMKCALKCKNKNIDFQVCGLCSFKLFQ